MTTASENPSKLTVELEVKKQQEWCMLNIKQWMDQMRLKMNPSKTEYIYFGNHQQLKRCTENQIDIASDLIVRSTVVHYLGVWMDQSLNLKEHVTHKCQAGMLNFLRLRSIRHLLDNKTTANLCLSLCMSHVDYCNSILCGLLDCTLNKLQHLQNMCAHLVLRKGKTDSITHCLKALHWLPVKQRIEHKILTLTHKCLAGAGPGYLRAMLQYRTNQWNLRSTSSNLLVILRTKCKTLAARAFSVSVPTLWNQLPENIRAIQDPLSFKKAVKTHLFQQAFPAG